MELRNLEGVSTKKRDCDFFNKASQIRKILSRGLAATAADSNGALNIWKDDDGNFRCNAMRHLVSIEKRQFESMALVEKWAKKWLIKIK